MAGNKGGRIKARDTNWAKYGLDFYSRIGKKGGSISTPTGGFGSSKVGKDGLTGPQRAKIVGKKGGSISRRGRKKKANR